MSDLHPLVAIAESKEAIEAVDERFLNVKLHEAQKKSWEVFYEIKSELKEGLTELQAFELSRQIFKDHGVQKHWHLPVPRFGRTTIFTFFEPLERDHILRVNDPVYFDLGPVWFDEETGLNYEADVGDTFVFGENAEAEECAKAAREVFSLGKELWKEQNLTGQQLHEKLCELASERGYILTEKVQGHRIGDFPHQKYSKTKLGALQFKPSADLWVLEVHLTNQAKTLGAFYEDLL